MLTQKLQQRLDARRQANLYRQRKIVNVRNDNYVIVDGKICVSYCSNDYLNLAQNSLVIQAFKKGADTYGVGAKASQLVSGHSLAHHELELAFANFLQRDRAIYFANGYMANQGILTALCEAEDHIYQDKQNHASLLDAAKLSDAKSQRFLHNDLENLITRIRRQQQGEKFIVSDSVFSMTGKIANLPGLVATAKNYNGTLIIDDAHGIGVLGKKGAGITEHFQLSQQDLPVLVCPLGKAFGCYGAIVAGSHQLIEALIQFARSYIYTTASPPAMAAAARKSLEIITRETWRRDKLRALIAYFQNRIQESTLNYLPSNTPIQSIVFADITEALKLQETLLQQNIMVYVMRPPSVAANQTLIRIALNVAHTEAQIDKLITCLVEEYEAVAL